MAYEWVVQDHRDNSITCHYSKTKALQSRLWPRVAAGGYGGGYGAGYTPGSTVPAPITWSGPNYGWVNVGDSKVTITRYTEE